jgi:hypothetical protein
VQVAAAPSAPGPAVRPSAPDAPEREFLAMCIAVPTAGLEALRALDPQRDLSSSLLRRAHAHLLGHLAAPADGIADDDGELRALVAELVITADADEASERKLRQQRLQLELTGVTRQRDHAPANEQPALSQRRIEVQAELARAMQA